MGAGLNFGTKVVFVSGAPLTLPILTADPGTASAGDMYFNSTSNQVRVYDGTSWAGVGSGSANVNQLTLSNTDISNKFVTLTEAPTVPTNTILNVIGGPAQEYGVDFTVTNVTLSWSGLALDGVLSSGDVLIVQFQ